MRDAVDPISYRVLEAGVEICEKLNGANDEIKDTDGDLDVLWLLVKEVEQDLGLLEGGHGLPGASHWQNLVPAILKQYSAAVSAGCLGPPTGRIWLGLERF